MYRADRNGELYLCRHCASQLRRALSAQGWTIRAAGEQALGPDASEQILPYYDAPTGPKPSDRR
jgi:hypothetical protein